MSTKLQAMVGYLSGLDGDPRLLEELADPSSEASRFLESTRERSRALLGGPTFEVPGDRARTQPRRRFAIAALIATALVAIAIGAVVWLANERLRRLEAVQARTAIEAEARGRRLEAALARIAESTPALDPIVSALGRVEVGLGKLERRIEALDRKPKPPPSPKADPIGAEVLDDLATLRRELSAAEKANARQVEELRASVQEVARVLRLLLNRTQPPAPNPPPVSRTLGRRPAPAFVEGLEV